MEPAPKFLRDFSKEHSQGDRDATAAEIHSKRAEQFNQKSAREADRAHLSTEIAERDKSLRDTLGALEQLKEQLANNSSSTLQKIIHILEVRKAKADILEGEKTYEQLQAEQEQGIARLADLESELANETASGEPSEAQELLRKFYQSQQREWSKAPYSPEEMKEYFSEEHLASLSEEEYATLLQRFPSHMVTHVTRQGVRDHTGLMEHTSGADAYAAGFMNIVEDGRLRSALAARMGEEINDESVAKSLGLERFKTREEAERYLAAFTGSETNADSLSMSRYADRAAIHFAAEEVADSYYGAETGNEIFFAYPSAHIASQYFFRGKLNEGGGGYWNDQWVWANELRGMDLNAGLTFIPKDAKVDAETGSRYALDADKKPQLNQSAMRTVREVVTSKNFPALAKRASEVLGHFTQNWSDPTLWHDNPKHRRALEPIRLELEQEFGVTDMRIQRAILDYRFLDDMQRKLGDPSKDLDDSVEDTLRKRAVLFEEAQHPILSQDFWENYFARHPGKKPNKVIYYSGGDPTGALYDWKSKHGVRKRSPESNLGFAEHDISENDPRATAGRERFISIAQKVIDERYGVGTQEDALEYQHL